MNNGWSVDIVEDILTAENLAYQVDTISDAKTGEELPVVRLGFDDAMIAIVCRPDGLIVDAIFKESLPDLAAPICLAIVNEWNLTQIMPVLSFEQNPSGDLSFRIHRRCSIVDPSRNQAGAYIMSSMEGIQRCHEWVRTQIGEAAQSPLLHDGAPHQAEEK